MASPRTWIRARAIRALAPARLRAYHKLQGQIEVSPGERTDFGRRSRSAARQTTVCLMLVRSCRARSPRAGQVHMARSPFESVAVSAVLALACACAAEPAAAAPAPARKAAPVMNPCDSFYGADFAPKRASTDV